MTRREQLDEVRVLDQPLDVLAQHLVGMAMEGGYTMDAAFTTVRRSLPFAKLTREQFDRVAHYLQGGGRSLERQYADTFGKLDRSRWPPRAAFEESGARLLGEHRRHCTRRVWCKCIWASADSAPSMRAS